MKIKYSPQKSNSKQMEYEFNGEKITATLTQNGQGYTDTFDFSGLPEGKLEEVETELPVNPILSAERKDGVLWVKLLKYHGNARELFKQYSPSNYGFSTDWQEVG